ncbi:N-acetylmuramoyl-L-alanine amidase [Escherichia coli]
MRRDGEIVQYVPFDKRTWRAGVSRSRGANAAMIFLFGSSLKAPIAGVYRCAYQQLAAVTRALIDCYPDIAKNMTGHCECARSENRSRPLHLIGHGFVYSSKETT